LPGAGRDGGCVGPWLELGPPDRERYTGQAAAAPRAPRRRSRSDFAAGARSGAPPFDGAALGRSVLGGALLFEAAGSGAADTTVDSLASTAGAILDSLASTAGAIVGSLASAADATGA
jgi:hypothetical protein